MGLKDFRIALDNQWSTYYPGQAVTGNIIVVLDSTKKIRGEFPQIYLRLYSLQMDLSLRVAIVSH